ncbi:hypothetical protein CEXT_520601 [Caerostris extrusa]|uniref:Uncharacterized protein n=1 Tax=Caerostris extrusa TaxID=172846 RepID=A0AAV4T5R7_CAEEX|nr:hypothetical protein CEXT_520601 [Caerostris extrusa]
MSLLKKITKRYERAGSGRSQGVHPHRFPGEQHFRFAGFALPSTALRLTPKEWLDTQLKRHRKAFHWVRESQLAIEGLLLMNVERHSVWEEMVTQTITSAGCKDDGTTTWKNFSSSNVSILDR